ncbi:MAG TPA: alpha/beta fold hydrolase [Mycobacteriales bacterium]|nr:alpha/beta fold hydrolase [Mycobacteriales bacterium]
MRLHVDERGEPGLPVGVVIHSAGLIGSETVDIFGLGIDGFRVLAPDRTNYGQSPRSTTGGTGRSQGGVAEVSMIEDDAEAIAELLGDGGHLFGYSYGGIVALVIAARYPDRVRSLSLLEPPAMQLLNDGPALATRQRIEAALDQDFADTLSYWRAFMTGAFGDPPMPPDAVPADRQEASRREQSPWEVDIDLNAIAAAGVPTLVICGGWDPGFQAVGAHLTAALAARYVEFPDADHFFFNNAADIGREVEQWWRRHEAK